VSGSRDRTVMYFVMRGCIEDELKGS